MGDETRAKWGGAADNAKFGGGGELVNRRFSAMVLASLSLECGSIPTWSNLVLSDALAVASSNSREERPWVLPSQLFDDSGKDGDGFNVSPEATVSPASPVSSKCATF